MSIGMAKRAWHVESVPQLFQAVQGNEPGLTTTEAGTRRERYGPNRLPERVHAMRRLEEDAGGGAR